MEGLQTTAVILSVHVTTLAAMGLKRAVVPKSMGCDHQTGKHCFCPYKGLGNGAGSDVITTIVPPSGQKGL